MYKYVFPKFLENIFSFGEESQTEIFRNNTRVPQHTQKLGKFTNWLKNNVVCPKVTNNIPSFVLG